jgi:hypothetical protein
MRLLRTPVAEEFPIHTRADHLASILFQNAISGDTRAISEVCDRTEGKPMQALQISTEQLPTHVIVEKLVEAFLEVGIEEEMTRKVLLQLSAGDDD